MLSTIVGKIHGGVDGEETTGVSVTGGVKEGASEVATRTRGIGMHDHNWQLICQTRR